MKKLRICRCRHCEVKRAAAHAWVGRRCIDPVDPGFDDAVIVDAPGGPFVRVGDTWTSWHGSALDKSDIACLRATYAGEPVVVQCDAVEADVDEPRLEGDRMLVPHDDSWIDRECERMSLGEAALAELDAQLQDLGMPPIAEAAKPGHGRRPTVGQRAAIREYVM